MKLHEYIAIVAISVVSMLIGSAITIAIFETNSSHHNGVYEIGFKDQGTVNRFTIYKNRLHLMVALPVTGESGQIADIAKETKDAKDKPGTISRTPNPKDNKPTRSQRWFSMVH